MYDHPLELLGVLVAAGAWFCSLATTMMPSWLTLSTELLPTESFQVGLWETCVIQEMGLQGCRPYDSLLGLPADIKLARITMCIALSVGLLCLLVSIPGLNVVNSCQEERRCKRLLKAAGGTLTLVAGILVLVPVSYIAHTTVVRFFDESMPHVVPRWEFGDALFCGWAAGVLHLVAGTLLLVSSRHHDEPNCQLPIHIPERPVRIPAASVQTGSRSTDKPRAEYV